MSSNNWVFTLNNPRYTNWLLSPDNPELWFQSPEHGIRYIIWQHEIGANGTRHLQGYLILDKKQRLSWLKNNISNSTHWEIRRGTHAQAKTYVQKDETRADQESTPDGLTDDAWANILRLQTEFGDEPAQGKRSDLIAYKAALDEGLCERDIAEDDELFPTWAKYYRAGERYKRLRGEHQRDWETTCTVYWGPPGVGKSRRARHEGGTTAFWLARPNNGSVWWDGYDGQECVILDDFEGWLARNFVQRLIDRYPLNVETKGGSTPFVARHIIITSNQHPSIWWRMGLGPVERRLTTVIHMTASWPPPNLLVPLSASESDETDQIHASQRIVELACSSQDGDDDDQSLEITAWQEIDEN